MNGYETYKLYKAIGLHFSKSNYDFFKYNGKTNITPNAWEKRRDKYHFEKLGYQRKQDLVMAILVSYYSHKPDQPNPSGTEISDHVRDGYVKWKGKLDSLEKIFEEDLCYMKNYAEKNCTEFSSLFKLASHQQHPHFLKMIISKNITYETAIIFDLFTNVFEKMDENLNGDLVWDDYYHFLRKYSKFLNVNKNRYGKIIKKVLKKD